MLPLPHFLLRLNSLHFATTQKTTCSKSKSKREKRKGFFEIDQSTIIVYYTRKSKMTTKLGKGVVWDIK